jgi:hypothetical protein
MEIKIKDTIVETKYITAIDEYVRDQFYNRYCGFVVHLHRKEPLTFEWNIPYESYPSEIEERKMKCILMMKSIIEEWEKDKVIYELEIPIKNFDM